MRGHRVGCPEGGLALLLALQKHQMTHPTHAFIKLDLKNVLEACADTTARLA